MNILKYILLAMFCIPIILVLWMVGLVIIAMVGFPLVIKGVLEAVHNEVYK